MADHAPVARSPIAPPPPVVVAAGWEVSSRATMADPRLLDCTPLTKILVRAPDHSGTLRRTDVTVGRAARHHDGALVARPRPGEALLLGPPNAAEALASELHPDPGDGFVSVIDVTHGRAAIRLTGSLAPTLLAKICAIDFSDRSLPDGTALGAAVARVRVDLIRDDTGDKLSYLLLCERTLGQYLFDVLLDAGQEFATEVDGFYRHHVP